MTLRIGSLCTGYGGLDMALLNLLGGTVAWHAQFDPDDKHQYAAQILAHRFPGVPNVGDITVADWLEVIKLYGPIDVLTAGFPCQDVSLAGKRAGIAEGTRSGLWLHVARAIQILKPRLVVIENVRGILSQKADRGMAPRAEDLGRTGGAALVLRALGAVLGDLASLGLDAEWAGVRAEEVGATHERFREFVLAWPRQAAADADDERGQGAGASGREPQRHVAGADRGAADTAGEGLEGQGLRGRSAERGRAAQDSDVVARGERRIAASGQEEGGRARADAGRRGRVPAAGRSGECPTCLCPASDHDAEGLCAGCLHCIDPELGQPGSCPDDCPVCAAEAAADTARPGRSEGRRHEDGIDGTPGAVGPGEPPRDGAERDGGSPADADGDAVRQQSVGERGRGGTAVAGLDRAESPADADSVGRGPDERDVREGQRDVEWGRYEPAIRRWEEATGWPAPRPTDDRGRLSPPFVEWMMGLPAGHVTGVPGIPRAAQLKALGNGVVPQQAEAAVRLLLDRIADEGVLL